METTATPIRDETLARVASSAEKFAEAHGVSIETATGVGKGIIMGMLGAQSMGIPQELYGIAAGITESQVVAHFRGEDTIPAPSDEMNASAVDAFYLSGIEEAVGLNVATLIIARALDLITGNGLKIVQEGSAVFVALIEGSIDEEQANQEAEESRGVAEGEADGEEG